MAAGMHVTKSPEAIWRYGLPSASGLLKTWFKVFSRFKNNFQSIQTNDFEK